MSIILVKANKGGVGKSWITLQLAHNFSKNENKKVLILTSDSQNNIPSFCGTGINTRADLEEWILNGNSELMELRNNLFYIPFHSVKLDNSLKHKFETFINTIKSEFDYIFIDSTPVLNLDDVFVGTADQIVIPTFLDLVTTESILSLLDTVPANKVKAIIPNRTGRCRLEKAYFQSLKDVVGSYIYLSVPVRQSAFISKMIDQGRTIWESKSRAALEVQSIFQPVLDVIKNGQ